MSLSQRHVDNSKASQTEPSQANPLFVNLNANYMRQPTLCGLFTCNWYLREECNCDCVSVNVTAADTGDCNCNCDCVRERASERTNEWDSIRFGNFKMCLPNTYIMYEQTVNTALAKLSRLWSSKIFVWMRNIVQIHGHKSRQPLFFFVVYASISDFWGPFAPSRILNCFCLFSCANVVHVEFLAKYYDETDKKQQQHLTDSPCNGWMHMHFRHQHRILIIISMNFAMKTSVNLCLLMPRSTHVMPEGLENS